MDYSYNTITNAGNDLMAQTSGDGNDNVIIDKAILSNQQFNNTNESLKNATTKDFQNSIITQIYTVKHEENTFQPEIEINNNRLQNDYPIYMIGILAHSRNNPNNEILYAIATDDNAPFILPKSKNKFDLSISVPISISDSSNVNIQTTEAGLVTYDDLHKYQNNISKSFSSLNTSLSLNALNIDTISSEESDVSSSLNNKEDVTSADSAHNYLSSGISSLSMANSALSLAVGPSTGSKIISLASQLNNFNNTTGSTLSSNINSLSNTINSHPTWSDENRTRNNIAPSLANSAKNDAINHANTAASNALNQANATTESNQSNLQNQINNRATIADRNWTRNMVAPSLANSARDAANVYTNGQTNSLSSQIQNDENNILFHNQGNITTNSPKNAVSTMIRTGIASIYGGGQEQGLPEDNIWGDLYIINKDMYSYTVQIVTSVLDNTMYFRTSNTYSTVFKDIEWHKLANSDDINSLQSQLNNSPRWSDENHTRQREDDLQGQITRNYETEEDHHNNLQDQIADARNYTTKATTNAFNQALADANINMETNRRNLQGQINNSDNNILYHNKPTITGSTDSKQISLQTTTGIGSIYGAGTKQGLPQDNIWGDYYVIDKENYGYIVQEVIDVLTNREWFRACNVDNSSLDNIPWKCITDPIQIANNEDDAQNQSKQHPGTLYVYND